MIYISNFTACICTSTVNNEVLTNTIKSWAKHYDLYLKFHRQGSTQRLLSLINHNKT
ncbi:hypothetical protein BDA96_10G290400 [Sorghum bicolor]|uniref:Uncharacterized protein n=1 Tax=Sorghum bicolor TaxID=4558 RepID=A0A921U2D2_SORBI|nr:hypothetical protein BDA96_10G290400 [Sorghum bicolor]